MCHDSSHGENSSTARSETMRIILVGATGTIGSAVARELASRHEVLPVSHKSTPITVDLGNPDSIRSMYKAAGTVDAVISAAGLAKFGPLAGLSDADFAFSLSNKLMGQVNLVRLGFENVHDNGCFVLTSGILARHPMPGSAAISLVNAGLEGFARAAAAEAPRGIRVNVVSPPWIKETLDALGMDPANGMPAATVAKAYVRALEGSENGAVIDAA
jgi:NAD(P)-dependent dehydrogenase (short-subunit alcohol dehydrogenase family)